MKKPNILIMMADHHRGDTVLPCHPAITPNLERLARDGVRFSNAFCPSPHCCPSRATFFTGLYPSRHGVWNHVGNPQSLSRGPREGVRLWSEDLAAAGYELDFMGKWHVSSVKYPSEYGWNEGNTCHREGILSLPQEWDMYANPAPPPSDKILGGLIRRSGYNDYHLYGTSEVQEDGRIAREAMDIVAAKRNSRVPWGVFVGFKAPHDPYLVPRRFLDMYDPESIPLPPNYNDAMADKPALYRRMRRQAFGKLTDDEVRSAILHFWAYCSYLDHLAGNIIKALDDSGQANDTIVLYCSDHGDYCGEHGLFSKGIPCFRGAYHVPAIMRWPSGIKSPGREIDALVSLADFAPTFRELAGLPCADACSGNSLAPFLRNQTPANWPDEIFTQCNGTELYVTQRSVSTKAWKYVFNGFDFDELYDLRNDPGETRNLIDEPDCAMVLKNLCQRLWRFTEREEDMPISNYITVGLAPYGPGILHGG
jgi:arylsulfatase A-like enzyme